MRICIHKATKRIIEMQGGEDDRPDLSETRLNTLKQNALNAGHAEADIEVKWVTEAEYAAAKAEDPNEIARIAEQEVAKTKSKLTELDLKSIRSIREYLAAKPDAPEYLKTYEARAIAARAVITK